MRGSPLATVMDACVYGSTDRYFTSMRKYSILITSTAFENNWDPYKNYYGDKIFLKGMTFIESK